ncbi:MAG: LBF_2804 family protein [Methylobacter sp.]
MSINKSHYTRETPIGFLERAGVNYYRRLAESVDRKTGDYAEDDSLCFLSVLITDYAAIIAFFIGAGSSIPAVVLEWLYMEKMDFYHYIALQIGVGLLFLLVELVLLYWLGLKTVHSIACLTRHHQTDDESLLPGDDTVANLLARAALELPDPVVRYLGIDPLKYISKSRLLIIGVLYKLKVVLSSLIVKFLLTRMAGKLGLRTSFSWVAIPITGIWDAIVIYRVVKEARLRVFGHRLAHYIVEDVITPDLTARLSSKAKEGAVRAIATMMVLTQKHHPNMLILLFKFSDHFAVQDHNDYDDWQAFLNVLNDVSIEERYFLLDLLSIAAVFDGHLSPLEKRLLPEAFGNLNAIYMARIQSLKKCLLSGHIHAAKALCQLNFQPEPALSA